MDSDVVTDNSPFNNNDNAIQLLYSAQYSVSISALQNYTITPVIGFSACPHTLCAQSPLPGEHSCTK